MGKQKTRPKQEEIEGPAAPVAVKKTAPAAAIQMTPSHLSARLSKAQTDEELDRAFESTLNYLNTLSSDMSDKEYKENRALLQQVVIARNAQAEKELQPKLADECIERLSEILKAPPAAKGTKTEIPLQFQQFGFFQLSDIAGQGSVAFGNLPSQMAQQLHEEDFETALTELNNLVNALYAGGDTKKAGQDYLKFLQNLFEGYGYSGSEVNAVISQFLTQADNADDIIAALKNGNYEEFFGEEHPDASFSEWQRAGTNNYLVWTSKELELILSVEAAKYIVKGKKGEFGVTAKGTVHKETTHTVRSGEPGLWGREEKSRHLPGGGGGLYGEVGEGRWKAGARVGADYVPGVQGGWFIPVEIFGEVGGGTDATSQTVRLQVKASPEVTGTALNLEGGVLWNALFFQKGDTAVGYVFGVKGARMSTTSNGTTNVDLVIEGQLGPTFQKIFREQGLVLWAGVAGIVQQEVPQGTGAAGPLEPRTKVGAGFQTGIKGEKAEGFFQIQLNPIAVTPATDFTGREEQGAGQGVMGSIVLKF